MRKVCDNELGATAIEYGLIIGGIAVAIMGIVFTLGNDISDYFKASRGCARGFARGRRLALNRDSLDGSRQPPSQA